MPSFQTPMHTANTNNEVAQIVPAKMSPMKGVCTLYCDLQRSHLKRNGVDCFIPIQKVTSALHLGHV